MDTKTLDKDTRNKLRFATFIIPKLADAYKMDRQEVYRYLKNTAGLITFTNVGGRCTPITLFGKFETCIKYAEITEVCDESISLIL